MATAANAKGRISAAGAHASGFISKSHLGTQRIAKR